MDGAAAARELVVRARGLAAVAGDRGLVEAVLGALGDCGPAVGVEEVRRRVGPGPGGWAGVTTGLKPGAPGRRLLQGRCARAGAVGNRLTSPPHSAS